MIYLEKAKSVWNRQSESKKPTYSLKLRKIVSDAEGYLYEHDPNFDFDNRDVIITRHDSMRKVKENQIKKYYEKVENGEKSMAKRWYKPSINTPRAKKIIELECAYDLLNSNTKFSENIVRTRKDTDYGLTKVKKDIIAPGKMRPRAPCKLKDVCKENGYSMSINDFDEERRMIGNGTFGEVFIVNCKLNDCKYALKILNKQTVKELGFERHIMREKDILNLLDHPNIVRLEHYFHDSDNCYFLFELCEVGDLATFINENRKLSSRLTREFTMEIILALEELRKLDIVHRDLKPQNILLDDTFHIKLADFGAAKMINPEEVKKEISGKNFSYESSDDDSSTLSENDDSSDSESEVAQAVMLCRENTQIGSPYYVSPEMVKYQIACHSSDLWALGCIIYQCLTGNPPFTGKNKFEVEDKITNVEFEFPKGFNKDAKDLVCKLLKLDPTVRLGAGELGSSNDINALKSHPFFKGKSFKRCHKRTPALHTLKIKTKVQKYLANRNLDMKVEKDLITENTIETADIETPDSVRSMCFDTTVAKAESNEIEEQVKDEKPKKPNMKESSKSITRMTISFKKSIASK